MSPILLLYYIMTPQSVIRRLRVRISHLVLRVLAFAVWLPCRVLLLLRTRTALPLKALLVTSGALLGSAYSHAKQNPEDWEKSKLGLTRSAGELIDAKA